MRQSLLVLLGFVCLALISCESPMQRYERGNTSYLRGNYQEALDHYLAARRSDPSLTGIDGKIRETEYRMRIQEGDTAVQQHRWGVAEQCFQAAERLQPGSEEVQSRTTSFWWPAFLPGLQGDLPRLCRHRRDSDGAQRARVRGPDDPHHGRPQHSGPLHPRRGSETIASRVRSRSEGRQVRDLQVTALTDVRSLFAGYQKEVVRELALRDLQKSPKSNW